MVLEPLEITKEGYIKLLKNRGKAVKSDISDDKLLRKVKYFTKKDFKNLANIRNIVITK